MFSAVVSARHYHHLALKPNYYLVTMTPDRRLFRCVRISAG